jgi:hypothetical protein
VQDYGLYIRVVNHPTVIASSGRREGGAGPSYLSGATFANALVDSIISRATQLNAVSGVGGNAQAGAVQAVRELERWGSMTARALRPMLAGAQTDDQLKEKVASWYDQSMERISGTYKRGTQAWLFWMGVVTAGALNIDTLAISRELWRNPQASAAIAAQAQKSYESGELGKAVASEEAKKSAEDAKKAVDEAKKALEKAIAPLDIPFGYKCASDEHPFKACTAALEKMKYRDMMAVFIGWLLTGLAVSFGATFWFDLLAKVINVRSAGQKPAKTPRTAPGEGQ